MGPGDRHNWTRLILLLDRNQLPGAPPGAGAFADVRCVARAHLAAWRQGRSGESYLLGGDYVSFLDLLRRLAADIGCAPPRRALPAGFLRVYAKALELLAAVTGTPPRLTPEGAALTSQHLRVDSAKAMAELGYAPTPIDELVRDTVRWLRAEGLLRPR
jgi:nucleoside-diphosphate-sugar epimerase